MPDPVASDQASDLDALAAKAMAGLNKGAPDYTGDIENIAKRVKQVNQDEKNDPVTGKLRSRIASDADEVERKRLGIEPLDVKPWNARAEKEAHETDPMTAFGSAAGVLGMLASAFTHTPMENVFNAAAASMTAIRKGDEKAYADAHDAWKENIKLALDRHKTQQDEFENAMGQLTTDSSAMKTYALKYGDQRAQLLAEAGLYSDLSHLSEARQNAYLRLLEVMPALEKSGTQYRGYLEDPDRASADPAKRLSAWQKWFAPPLSRGQSAESLAVQQFITNNPNAKPEDLQRFIAGMKGGGKTPQMVALNKFIADNPDATAEQIQKFLLEFKEDAPGVAARKEGELDLKREKQESWERVQGQKLKQNEEKITNTEEYRKNFFDAKKRGMDDQDAHWHAMEEHWHASEQAAMQKINSTPAAQKAEAVKQIFNQQEIEKGRELTGEEKLQIINNSGMPAGDAVDATAKLISNYQMRPLSGYAMRSAFGGAVMKRVSEMNPDYSETRYNEINRARTQFGTGKQGDARRFLNVAVQHIGVLDDLSQKLRNGDIKAGNTVKNMFADQFGDPYPNDFDAVKKIVAQEITKAAVGSAATGAERQELEKNLGNARTYDSIHDVLSHLKRLMGGQLNGLRKQYEDSTGLKDFNESLFPETIKALGGNSSGNVPAGFSVKRLD